MKLWKQTEIQNLQDKVQSLVHSPCSARATLGTSMMVTGDHHGSAKLLLAWGKAHATHLTFLVISVSLRRENNVLSWLHPAHHHEHFYKSSASPSSLPRIPKLEADLIQHWIRVSLKAQNIWISSECDVNPSLKLEFWLKPISANMRGTVHTQIYHQIYLRTQDTSAHRQKINFSLRAAERWPILWNTSRAKSPLQ